MAGMIRMGGGQRAEGRGPRSEVRGRMSGGGDQTSGAILGCGMIWRAAAQHFTG
ncbi:MAG: hypothetical protein QG577_400 [Thermodesulfobacteriota bacterium]|nr:hypothetical protein [Thermodesulfobacteriota bacterium]